MSEHHTDKPNLSKYDQKFCLHFCFVVIIFIFNHVGLYCNILATGERNRTERSKSEDTDVAQRVTAQGEMKMASPLPIKYSSVGSNWPHTDGLLSIQENETYYVSEHFASAHCTVRLYHPKCFHKFCAITHLHFCTRTHNKRGDAGHFCFTNSSHFNT